MAIVGIVTAVTIPNIAKSIRGNRLRTAARTVVMAGRYARSMAVLRQQDMAILFEAAGDGVATGDRVLVRPVPTRESARAVSGPDSGAGPEEGFASLPPTGTNASTVLAADVAIIRELDRVRIVSLQLEAELAGAPGEARQVVYGTNGRCAPYSVTLEDESGGRVTIRVDALSSVEVENGNL
jgi:type II secretory pathway pseudopilin PulG